MSVLLIQKLGGRKIMTGSVPAMATLSVHNAGALVRKEWSAM
jgi:hypothetical protein